MKYAAVVMYTLSDGTSDLSISISVGALAGGRLSSNIILDGIRS